MNALVSFLLIATVIYFFVVLPINALTSEGSVIRKVFADHARGMEDALSSLDASEKETLRNLLRKVSHAAENRASGQ